MKIFADEGESWFPKAITQEERQGLEALAGQAENLSNHDLKRLTEILGTLQSIDEQKASAVAEREAFARHYEDQRRREINERLRVHAQEIQVKRARIAAALGIPIDEVPELK